MNNRQKIWVWVSIAVSLIMGFILIINGSAAGWFLIILGIIYTGVSTQIGQSSAISTPRLTRWGLVGSLILVLSAVILSVVVLMK